MIVNNYSDDPVKFKTLWLDMNNPKGLLIEFPEFKQKITPVGSENPKTLGWYEHNKKTKKYTLTTDEIVVANKTYFVSGGTVVYTADDIADKEFKIKKSLQSGNSINFIGCIASTLEFKVANDFKYFIDQKITATVYVTELDSDPVNNVQWNYKLFTGTVDEVKRDKSRDLVRTITAHDFMYKLQDDYEVTDWYVWKYGDSQEAVDTKYTVKELRDSFWDYICNDGTVTAPDGQTFNKKAEGFTQVDNATLVNDNLSVGKTLNVAPVDYDTHVGGTEIGGPFEKGQESDIPAGWDITNLVARKQVIELGLVGTLFTYGSETETHYRKYLDDCDNAGTGLGAHIKVPKEEQDKVRETQISAATVLQAFCQFNGVFGQFNGDGQFEYISLDTSDPLEIDDKYQIEVKYSDTKMPDITAVVIFDKTSAEYSDDQIHTEYGDVKNGKKGSALAYYPDDRTLIEGDDANPFTLDDNFLANSYTHNDAMTMATNLYNHIHNISMRNCDIEILGMPWIKCGQAISYYAPTEDTLYPSEDLLPSEDLFPSDFQKLTAVVMEYEISGTGLFMGRISCNVEDLSSEIVNLNEVISDEMFQRKIGDSRAYSSFTQTAEKIELKVADDINKLSASINVELQSIELKIDGPNGLVSRIELDEQNIMLQSERITSEAQRIDLIASEQLDIKTRLLNIEAEELIIQSTKVSFTDLKTGGRTTINGANIITGTLTADRITLGKIKVDGVEHDVDWRNIDRIVTIAHGCGVQKMERICNGFSINSVPGYNIPKGSTIKIEPRVADNGVFRNLDGTYTTGNVCIGLRLYVNDVETSTLDFDGLEFITVNDVIYDGTKVPYGILYDDTYEHELDRPYIMTGPVLVDIPAILSASPHEDDGT